MSFLSPDKNGKLWSKLHTSRGQLNFSESNSNLADILNQSLHSSSSVSENSLYHSSTTDWVSPVAMTKASSVNTATSSLNSPIYSNNPNWIDKSFNKYESFNDDQNPRLLKSKEETAPSHLFTEYWETIGSNSSSLSRVKNNMLSQSFKSNFYLPSIEEYAEYDFKNWQALESLEDCFWESTFSSFSQEEYLNSLNTYVNSIILKRQEELYNSSTRNHKFKSGKTYKSPRSESSFNSLSMFSKEGFLNSPLIIRAPVRVHIL
jgi:hypothetical protein